MLLQCGFPKNDTSTCIGHVKDCHRRYLLIYHWQPFHEYEFFPPAYRYECRLRLQKGFFTICGFRFIAKIPALSEASAAFALGDKGSWLDFASLGGPLIVTIYTFLPDWGCDETPNYAMSRTRFCYVRSAASEGPKDGNICISRGSGITL